MNPLDPDLLIDVCQSSLLIWIDRFVRPKALRGTECQGLTSVVREEVSAVRLDRIEHCDYATMRPCEQSFLCARTHIHRFRGQSTRLDVDHRANLRTKWARPSGSEFGHFTSIDCLPSCGSLMIDISACLLSAVLAGTSAGNAADNCSPVKR